MKQKKRGAVLFRVWGRVGGGEGGGIKYKEDLFIKRNVFGEDVGDGEVSTMRQRGEQFQSKETCCGVGHTHTDGI